MSKGTLKPKKRQSASKKTGIVATVVTVVFAIIGVVCMIIGYHNEVLHWMMTTGVAFLVIAAFPILILVYNLISKKIES